MELGRPPGYLIFSLMALIRDPIYQYFLKGFRGHPSESSCCRIILREVSVRTMQQSGGPSAHIEAQAEV